MGREKVENDVRSIQQERRIGDGRRLKTGGGGDDKAVYGLDGRNSYEQRFELTGRKQADLSRFE